MSTLKRLLLAWLGLIVLILVVSHFLVTDSKRVNRVLQACERSLRNADADGILENVARDYQFEGLTWDSLREKASRILRSSQFPTTIMRNKHIKVAGAAADVRFTMFTQPSQGSKLPSSSTAWRLRLDKRGNQWVVTEIELLTVDGRPMGTLKQVMELAEGMGSE